MKRTTKGQLRFLRERIAKLREDGYSFEEIAKILGYNSKNIIRYHYLRYLENKKIKKVDKKTRK
jgi:transcriptional regulator